MDVLINRLANEPSWFWIVFGIIIFFIFRSTSPTISHKIPNWAETEKTRNFISFSLSLAIITGGLALSIWAIYITVETGGGKVNAEQIADQLKLWINLYSALIFILIGTAFGGFIWLTKQIIEGFRRKHKGNKQETETTISTKKLDSTAKEIEEYRKTKGELEDFFNKIQVGTLDVEDEKKQ